MARDLKAQLGQALDHRKAKAPRKADAKKPTRAKRPRGDHAMSQADRLAINLVVTPEQRRKGEYQFVDHKIQEVVEGGKVKAKTERVIRNLGGTPCERWHRLGKLDARQMAAVLFYQEAYRKVFGEGPRVCASYSPAVSRNASSAVELYAGGKLAAKESLRLLDQEVFFRLPIEHFQVWQNVVIWHEPAGIAGSRIGFCHKPAQAVALSMVATMAAMIADIVIDASRRDFGELLLDLDAPRRPGRRAA